MKIQRPIWNKRLFSKDYIERGKALLRKKNVAIPSIVAIICLLLGLVGGYLFKPPQTPIFMPTTIQPKEVTVVPDGPAIITQIQTIGKLETVSYKMRKDIVYDPDDGQWYHFLGDRKELFIVRGEVTAGFDLSELHTEDIVVNGKEIKVASVTLNMAAPRIVYSKVNLDETKVYDLNSSGVYRIFNSNGTDSDTTRKVLASSEKLLRNDACTDGILKQAKDSAKVQLTALLQAIGFQKDNIQVNFQPYATCE